MGLIITKIKVIIFSFLLFLLLFSFSATAFEDTVEAYSTDYTELYTTYASTGTTITVSQVSDVRGVANNHVFYIKNQVLEGYTGTSYLIPKISSPQAYFSYIVCGYGYSDGNKVTSRAAITVLSAADNSTLAQIIVTNTSLMTNSKYEIIKNGASFDLYINGIYQSSASSSKPSYTGNVYFCPGAQAYNKGSGTQWENLYIDDLSTSSVIGSPQVFTESNVNITYTWSAQLMRSYPSSTYEISLYSLTNSQNAGKLTSWTIPSQDNATTSEHGYLYFSRSAVLGENFGLYMLEMSRDDDVLTDTYFYYDQLSNPQGFPELLFLAESSVKADIRDDDNNGGEIAGEESVYLYPDVQEDGTYNISYDIKETPFAINTEISKVYNTTALNGVDVHFSGLASQNYNISVDGQHITNSGGSDTWNYTLSSWDSVNSHTISFAPDYTHAGVWGEVKNSVTQKPIKSASVAITGGNISKYLYTDDNGIYYLTLGMEAGQTYNVTASKTGYSTSNPASVTTTEGATTRTDFYLDPTSGEGIYYAPHSVTFTILENWYNYTGLPGVPYSVYDNIMDEEIKTGSTDSKGQFTVKEMDGGTNYTITLSYNGKNITEYVEPGLSEYTFVLNKEGSLHTYMNNWLTLSYAQNSTNATVTYSSNKTLTGASLIATASNGTITYNQVLTTQTGSFFVPFSPGDYSLQFHIEASDGSEASQVWTITNPATVNLFPTSYPAWLKNTLFTAVILIFLLAFGKSKNDIACGSVAVLTSLGYFFKWLTCSFNFVVLVWIIAAGAIYLHYKRTGAVG